MSWPDRPTPLLVWARAAVLGCAVVTTGAVSHVAAGGLVPGPAAMLALLGLATAAGALFLHRAASAVRLVVLVVSGQTLVHLALSGLAGHRGDPPRAPSAAGHPTIDPHTLVAAVPDGGHRAGSLADQWETAHTASTTPDTAAVTRGFHHLVEHATAQAPAMLLAHVGGAVALALWLAVGERALWHLLHLAATRRQVRGVLARALSVWAGPVAPPRPTRPALAVVSVSSPALRQRACRVVVRRGPPLLLAG